MKRQAVTIFVALSAAFVHAAEDPLEQASFSAAVACDRAAAESIQHCSTLWQRGQEYTAARLAAKQFFEAKFAYMSSCKTSEIECELSAHQRIEAGFARAFQRTEVAAAQRR